MPTMTPAEAATDLLTKTKHSSGKLVVDQENETGAEGSSEDAATTEELVLTQNGDALLLSQKDKSTGTLKRRNPGRIVKSAQGTIQESQNDGTETGGNKTPPRNTKHPRLHKPKEKYDDALESTTQVILFSTLTTPPPPSLAPHPQIFLKHNL
jgi:hypothetical protein